MKQLIKKNYSIVIFTVIMLFFIYAFSYAIWSISNGHGCLDMEKYDWIIVTLCILAIITYSTILIRAWRIHIEDY